VSDLKSRLAGISPERRALLERMLKEKGVSPGAATADARPAATEGAMADVMKKVATVVTAHGPQDALDKDNIQRQYNAYHENLRSAIFHDHSFFMNLGYVANDGPQFSPVALPERMIGRKYIKLALEVIGDCDLEGRRLLDVGCGRGGTIHVAWTWFRPLASVGIDLTEGAIVFCRDRHRYADAQFLRGNAERLPFADRTFDVVTNIESSHHYADIEGFYRGVHRVLVPGGRFLYATLLPVERFGPDLALLRSLGFEVERDHDITRNVCAACDVDRTDLFGGRVSADDDAWIADAVGLPGSVTYNLMASGRAQYRLMKLRKAG